MNLLGLIPARGGSKGIPRKNIKMIFGKPLIAWTIEAAQKSKLLNRFVVSTEDEEIAEVSRRFGAEVLVRPPELAEDHVMSRLVIEHALRETGADASVLLQPTSPVRDDDLIDRAIRLFLDGDFDSLATGWMNPIYPPHGKEHRRQDIHDVFVNDGSIIISTRETILAGSLFGEKAGTMVTDEEQNVDVDTDYDFWLAERVLERRASQDPDYLRKKRDQASRERHLLAVHFLKALQENGDEELTRQVAGEAFRSYIEEVWGEIFDDLPPEGRVEKFRQIIREAGDGNPDLEIIAQENQRIETISRQCGAEKLYRDHGLLDYFQFFCRQDFHIAEMISPTAQLKCSNTLPNGDEHCRHEWILK